MKQKRVEISENMTLVVPVRYPLDEDKQEAFEKGFIAAHYSIAECEDESASMILNFIRINAKARSGNQN